LGSNHHTAAAAAAIAEPTSPAASPHLPERLDDDVDEWLEPSLKVKVQGGAASPRVHIDVKQARTIRLRSNSR
jgi:hypothetical protein